MSRRTFQRTLAAENLCHQRLQSEVRFRLAIFWSLKIPIAEIGFICCYSDQAHLTREFNRLEAFHPQGRLVLFNLKILWHS